MKMKIALTLVASLVLTSSALAVKVGTLAPPFAAPGFDGQVHKLEDYKGKFVVLEWHNKDCPFVKKHYGSGNMQKLQKKWTAKNVAWLAVISSAPGKEGYADAAGAQADMKATDAAPTMVLLDPKGEVAHKYDAKTTPQMVVINPDGKII